MDFILSVLPPVIAIALAFITRNVIISLFIGCLAGVLIILNGNALIMIQTLIGDYFFVQLTEGYNAGIIVLLLFIGGFVTLIEQSGGGQAFAGMFIKYIKTRVSAQLGAFIGGLIIFFSDLGSPLINGPVFESIFDKLKISREKLAWIIDSTASPVAVMIPFIGWGVYIMGLLNSQIEQLSLNITDWDLFMQSLPYFIYPILAVTVVPVIILSKREIGPMRKAEIRTLQGKKYWDQSKPMRNSTLLGSDSKKAKPIMVWLPLFVMLAVLVTLLIPLGFPFGQIDGNGFRVALTTSYFLAAMVMIALLVYYKVDTANNVFTIYLNGMSKMTQIIIVLILAWSLGAIIDELETASNIAQLLDGNVPAFIIPALILIVGAFMSFASGSSWGTFAVMMPLAIPLGEYFNLPLMICVGAVISAGLFGDHSSPISDTTILSSTGAGSDLTDHNKTQIPISLMNGGITLITLLIAPILTVPWLVFLSIALMIVCVFIFGRKIIIKQEV
ncbi:Na+/H+ antiporter NhaC family protein [Jeotgalicoccus aerolatus]|nr:Na+/H+ antiporter NhaC family protein [Jeotgalicoccus aerolatus]